VSTSDGSDIAHARPTNALLRSVIGSATNILMPSGIGGSSVGTGSVRGAERGGGGVTSRSGRVSALTSSPAASALRRSPYHAAQRSKTFWRPSNTHTASGTHSTPLADEMNVRRTSPKRPASAPKAPM
jgi:hypothetical protein